MAITSIEFNGQKYDIGVSDTETRPYLYQGKELIYTWEQLQRKCENEDFSDLRIGDYKTILVDNEYIVMQIAGINTYRNVTYHGHIDWISKDCSLYRSSWGNTATNNGTGVGALSNPYYVSNIKNYLDNFYTKLPKDLKNVIANKIMPAMENRYNNSQTLSDSINGYAQNIVLGKLWLPTEYEVFGSSIWGTDSYSIGSSIQYPIFTNQGCYRVKRLGDDGQVCDWALATAAGNSSSDCCYITSSGYPSHGSVRSSYGVPICFRIMAL